MDERTLNDLLECSVCLERLDTTSKVLPCQHTFCRKCLEVIVASHSKLRCPECRILVEIKIEDLPPNVLLMRILEGMKNASHNQMNATKVAVPLTQKTGINLQMTNMNMVKNAVIPVHDEHPRNNIGVTKTFPNIPHARAIYDFLSHEAGDLCFKKGDRILLRERINSDWFVGELNGRQGTFPANYVQIIVSLPLPQCKALYDFQMGPNEEEGCLTFKKGAIINVLRRVDQNWAEGRIGDCIGIFPIAFVEMNSLAKHIMETYTNIPSQFSRSQPPTPTTHDLSSPSNDSGSLVTTSPNSSSSSTNTTSSNSSTAPSSPTNQLLLQNALPRDQKEKRHSLTAIMPNISNIAQQTNRHSAEILSMPEPNNHTSAIVPSSSKTHRSNNIMQMKMPISNQHQHHHHHPHQHLHHQQQQQQQQQIVPNLPATYVALYPYKPRKSDELELKKGSIYYVTERCQDGWYKGANRDKKTGVFPGNYVILHKNNREDVQMCVTKRQPSTNSTGQQQLQQQQQQGQHIGNHTIQPPPPELPPRSLAASSSGGNNTTSTSTSSVWSKPLGHHVESFFSKKNSNTSKKDASSKNESQSSPFNQLNKKESSSSSPMSASSSAAVNLMKRLTNIKRSRSPTLNSSAHSNDSAGFEDHSVSIVPQKKPIAQPPPSSLSSSSTSTSSATSTSTSLSSTNATKRNVQLTHPIHVRSGSCPSQLLQSLPAVAATSVHSTAAAAANESPIANSYMFGSQRVKGHKERPHLHGMEQTNNPFRSNIPIVMANGNGTAGPSFLPSSTITTAAGTPAATNSAINGKSLLNSYHRKSQSLDAATIARQIIPNAKNVNQKMAYAKERFRCIVSYPPNSEFELELHVGDIVFVHKKRENGWYKGTHSRTGKTGLFPASFVEPDL